MFDTPSKETWVDVPASVAVGVPSCQANDDGLPETPAICGAPVFESSEMTEVTPAFRSAATPLWPMRPVERAVRRGIGNDRCG